MLFPMAARQARLCRPVSDCNSGLVNTPVYGRLAEQYMLISEIHLDFAVQGLTGSLYTLLHQPSGVVPWALPK